jgi:hypothetical protein
MKKKRFLNSLFLFPLILFLLPSSTLAAKKKVEWVGRQVSDFTLPSNQDRAVTYAEDYYGKHHLIITFFPAAFTPI